MVDTTAIKIRKQTKQTLDNLKIVPEEYYDSVITRLIAGSVTLKQEK